MTPVTFKSGPLQLEGVLQGRSEDGRAAVVCHPHPLYGGDMESPVVVAVADGLRSKGCATLRFNFRGVGDSEGSYDGGTGEQDDVRAAIETVRDRTGATEIVLAGYSFGAMIAVQVVAKGVEGIGRLVLVAPPLAMMSLDALASCALPKLFIVGDRDRYCSLPILRSAVAALPKPADLHVISGADHFLFGRDSEIRTAVERGS